MYTVPSPQNIEYRMSTKIIASKNLNKLLTNALAIVTTRVAIKTSVMAYINLSFPIFSTHSVTGKSWPKLQ